MKNPTIVRAFETLLKAHGFQKHKGSWYLDQPETILVANLQKSDWGDQYFVNLAIWIMRLGHMPRPKENLCHLRMRLEMLAGQASRKFFDAEDFSISDEARETGIASLMAEHAIPFLDSCASLEGISEMLKQGKLKKGFVHRDVRGLLANEVG
jgi:hypothetical protein